MADGITQTNEIGSKSQREQDGVKRKTRETLERDGAMADGLTYTNKIARERGLEGAKER